MNTIFDMDFSNIPYGAVPFDKKELLSVRSAGRIPQDARSVLMFAFPYYSAQVAGGNVSVYCAVEDYHAIVKQQLETWVVELNKQHPTAQCAVFVDASPIPEVKTAAKAGLGVIGENGMLITPQYGSYVFLGEIITTLEVPYTIGEIGTCLRCGLCKTACPGGAITENGTIEEARCASAISQKKGAIEPWEEDILRRSGKAFGCDICQTVCPMNKDIAEGLPVFKKNICNNIDEETVQDIYKTRAFGWRGLAVLKRNLAILNGDKTDG